jgi:hypothetical protein
MRYTSKPTVLNKLHEISNNYLNPCAMSCIDKRFLHAHFKAQKENKNDSLAVFDIVIRFVGVLDLCVVSTVKGFTAINVDFCTIVCGLHVYFCECG